VLISRPSSRSRSGRVVALLAGVALATAACLGPTSQASPTPTLAPSPTPSANPYDGVAEGAGAGRKLGYISYGEQVPYVFQVSEGIRAQAALAQVELVECDARLEGSKVAGCVTELEEAGVEGIIQFQGTLADPEAVCALVPADVPVVAVEFAQEPCAGTLVEADDYRAGQIAGRAVGEWVKERWDCTYDAYVSFQSAVAVQRSQERMEGYRQGFSAVCEIKNEQIGPNQDTQPAAETAIREVLAALPEAERIVVVAVNSDAAIGALEGAKAAGREGDVWVSGQGGLENARQRIRDDAQYIGDAAYFPERFGRSILPALLDLLAGTEVQAQLLVEPAWIDATTIDEIYPQ
jgi:ribose transport system substrate-binding protein